jgi:hypothetical protein
VHSVLEHAVYRIVAMYGQELDQLDLPPLYAAKLQRFEGWIQ